LNIYFTAEYDPESLRPLFDMGNVIMDGWAKGMPKFTEEEIKKRSADAEIIITSYDDITRGIIENARHLKLLACTRATPVNVDMEAARDRGIPVLYTPGRNSDSTAEMAIGLMISIARKIPMACSKLKEGFFTGDPDGKRATKDGLKVDMIWDMEPGSPYMVFKGTQLHGKTLGIVGYGSIGRRVGRIARAMGMELLIHDPYVDEIDIEDFGIRKAQTLKQLMQESDFISCHMKVNEETRGCISREMIAYMKPTAYFINASRGAILDENAMIEALREKRIAGAAFDVYANEPIVRNHPYLCELDNVVITPHIAGATYEAINNHTRMIVSDVGRFLRGEQLMYQYKY